MDFVGFVLSIEHILQERDFSHSDPRISPVKYPRPVLYQPHRYWVHLNLDTASHGTLLVNIPSVHVAFCLN